MGTSLVGARTLAHGAEEESDTGSSIGDVRGLESAQGVEGSLGWTMSGVWTASGDVTGTV